MSYQDKQSISDRLGGIAEADQEFSQPGKSDQFYEQPSKQIQVPLLLKPNGAPVFKSVESDHMGLNQTLKQGIQEAQQASDLERTVKAHSFVVGKKVNNATNIQILDVQKNSAAQEQNFPVKVLYVKPGINKTQLKRKSQEPVVTKNLYDQKENTQTRNMEAFLKNADAQLENEVSLGEISGLFKKEPKPVPRPQKRVQSAPQKEIALRMRAQKEYAEHLRQVSKAKEEAKKLAMAAQGLEPPTRGQSGTPDEQPKLVEERPKPAHSENRYKGQFASMTEELFRKAQEKVREERFRAQNNKQDNKAKKMLQQQEQEMIKLRNREMIEKQKEKGPAMSLKQKEQLMKEQMHHKDAADMREKRRQASMKSKADRSKQMALDNVSKAKLAQHREQKEAERLYAEQIRRAKELADKREALERMAVINKDLIDFTHPDMGRLENVDEQQSQETKEEADEQAQEMMRLARKKALEETKMKRKIQEIEKKKAEEEALRKKQEQIDNLEQRQQRQREEFARKQRLALEKNAQEAAKRVKQSKASLPQGSSKFEKGETKKDRSQQLNELREWIDEQMQQEDARTTQHDTLGQTGKQQQKAATQQNPLLLGHQLPGNSMIPYELQRAQGVRENRYGINGDNGFDEMVEAQMQREGLDFYGGPQEENILDFKQASPQVQEDEEALALNTSYDRKPTKQEKGKRKIENRPVEEQQSLQGPVPGVLNAREEAARQKAAELQRHELAALVMQKWFRGWQARKIYSKRIKRTKREIEEEYNDFVSTFKANDSFNLNRFLKEKKRLRAKTGTDALEEDTISEHLGEQSIDALFLPQRELQLR